MIFIVSPCQTVEGQSFRRAELELALLDKFNSLLISHRSRAREDNINDGNNNEILSYMDRFWPLFLDAFWLSYAQNYEDQWLLFHCFTELLSCMRILTKLLSVTS